MAHEKSKLPKQGEGSETKKASKGQYGGLTGLGPRGGSDIEDATATDDIDPKDVQPAKK